MAMKTFQGIPVSPGVAMGKALVLHSEDFFTVSEAQIKREDVPREIVRFEEALTRARAELIGIRKNIAKEIGHEHSDIFSAHLLILEDRTFLEDVLSKIKDECQSAEFAFSQVIQRYFHAFQQIEDEYLKERLSDIKDVGRRIMQNLLGKEKDLLVGLPEKVIVVAHDLSPSETAGMDRDHVIAFATDIGGPTSHTAIMARSFEIPAVVGLESVSKEVLSGDELIIDGHRGVLIVNPDRQTIEQYTREEKKFIELIAELDKIKALPSETLDGKKIGLLANIEFPDEIPSVLSHGAEGIGLYRTEYFYLNRVDLPREEEQYEAYRTVVEKLSPSPVVVRTLDLGGDKFLSSLDFPQEMNPFMGWRAIRFCLAQVDVFKTQLRAILRASAHGNLMLMYPLISTVNEVRQANQILSQVKQEMKEKKIPFAPDIKVGVMIEIPSAAITSDILAKEVQFFSIGTNDLIQYSLAVDRVNAKVAYLYEPTHPAILRLIHQVVQNANKNSIPVSVCGEMAGDPAMAILLVGLGVSHLSMSPFALPTIKKAIRSIHFSQAREIAVRAMDFHTGEEIRAFVKSKVESINPDIFQH